MYGNDFLIARLVCLVPSFNWAATASGLKDGSTSGIVAPAMAFSSMATTSSPRRRPLGKPAASPATRPIGFSFFDAGTATFSRTISACTGPV